MDKKIDLNYQDDVKIDEFNLDEEFSKNPTLTTKWLKYYYDLEDELSDKKRLFKIYEAKLDKFLRENWDTSKSKMTETSLKNEIICDSEYQKLEKEILDLHHLVNIAKIGVEGIRDKKKSLEKLSDLYTFGYFSTPKQKSDVIEESNRDKIRDQIREKLNSKGDINE